MDDQLFGERNLSMEKKMKKKKKKDRVLVVARDANNSRTMELGSTATSDSQSLRVAEGRGEAGMSGQLSVTVSGGSRKVSQERKPDGAHAAQSRDLAEQHKESLPGGSANSNSNSRSWGKRQSKAERNYQRKGGNYQSTEKKGGGPTTKEKKEVAGSFKGKFVHLQGKELLSELAEHRIFELRKKNLSFPNAKYFCRLCEYHLDRPQDCERHADESRHRRKKEALDSEGILEHIPRPPLSQIRALDSLIEAVAVKEGLSPEELETRSDVVDRLQAFIDKFTDFIQLRLYGSSLTGLGLKVSDVNIEVVGGTSAPLGLVEICNILQKNGAPKFTAVQSDYNAKVPVVRLVDSQTGLPIVLAINSHLAVCTGQQLRLYALADHRLFKLAVALRTWAKICHLDRQEEGSLAPFVFNIMVVYFLQQQKPPVLDILTLPLAKPPRPSCTPKGATSTEEEVIVDFEYLKAKAAAHESRNKRSVGELWLGLLKFYCLDFDHSHLVVSIKRAQLLTRKEKKWHSKKLAVEDPFSSKKNIAASMGNTLIYEYFQSCLRKAYEYFGMPRDHEGNLSISLTDLRALAKQKTETLLRENQEASSASSSSASQSEEHPPQSSEDSPSVAEKTESDEKEDAVPDEKEGVLHEEKEGAVPDKKEGELRDKKEGELPDEKEGALPDKKVGVLHEEKEGELPDKKEGALPDEKEGELPDKKEGALPDKKEGEFPDDKVLEIPDQKVGEIPDEKVSSLPDEKEGALPNEKVEALQDDNGFGSSETERELGDSKSDLEAAAPEKTPIIQNTPAEETTSHPDLSSLVSAVNPEEEHSLKTEADLSSVLECSGDDSSVLNTDPSLDIAAADLTEGSVVDDSSFLSASGSPKDDNDEDEVYFETSDTAPEVNGSEADSCSERPTMEASPKQSSPVRTADTLKLVKRLPGEFSHLIISKEDCCESAMLTQNGDVSAEWDGYSDTYGYLFSEDVFTGGKGPAVICGYCEQEGHIKANCPDDQLPSVQPLPPMTQEHLMMINQVIAKIIYDFCPTEMQERARENTVRDLERFVRQIYPDAQFSLFGSSCNGFGFFSSDLDICMTFRGKSVEDIDVVEVIEIVAQKLVFKRNLFNVISIPTAKVPIVKFTDRETRLEGDISLYNTLAQRNTRLLKCYSMIDERVRILGYAVKVFAKVCWMGDASRGSLSSYGYILMMLHYLQQCRPPVIPVLQELRPEGEWPEYMVEGWNTWFFDDLQSLRRVWPAWGQNKQGVGELWLGFLCYYLEEFDWKGMVVSIRCLAPLTKFQKMWTGKTIAVEDPFDLSHNLGGALSRKMNNYIYSTFVRGRMHFGTPISQSAINYFPSLSDYFFAQEFLSDGNPPNDRGCRMCGKIGHLVKDCPNRPSNRRRQQQAKEKESKRMNNSQSQEGSQGNKEEKSQSSTKPKGQEELKADTTTTTTTPFATTVTTTSPITTMAASSSSPSTTTSSSRSPRVPPGFGPMGSRSQTHLPSSDVVQNLFPAAFKEAGGPRPAPVRQVSPTMRPPGTPMDVQQLFSMVQQSGNCMLRFQAPPNTPSQQQQQQPPGHPPTPPHTPVSSSHLLTPEQQVALFGGQSLSQSPQSPHSKLSPHGPGNAGMRPVPLMSLLHSPSSPKQQQPQQQHHPQMTSVPLNALFPGSPTGGGLSPSKRETMMGAQRMLVSPQQRMSEHHQQQGSHSPDIMKTLFHMARNQPQVLNQGPPPPGLSHGASQGSPRGPAAPANLLSNYPAQQPPMPQLMMQLQQLAASGYSPFGQSPPGPQGHLAQMRPNESSSTRRDRKNSG